MDIISRLPGCAGQAADAISAYTQVKMEDSPSLVKIPRSECPDIWIRLPRHKWPKSWSSMEDPVVPLEWNLYGHPLAGLLWERQFEKVLLEHVWEKFKIVNAYSFIEKRTILVCVCGLHEASWKETQHRPDVEHIHERRWFGRTDIIPWPRFILGCTQRECQTSKDIVDNYRSMFESRISAGAIERLPSTGKFDAKISSWSYDMEGHAKKCVERYCELTNRTT